MQERKQIANINNSTNNSTNSSTDAVEQIIQQWQAQGFADEQLTAMQTIGRIKRLEVLLMRQLTITYKAHQLTQWEFDVLATLRRAGEPFILSPTALFASMMVTSGTMTNRLQHLQEKALIQRIENPEDKRSLLVQLTDKGVAVIDKVVVAHIELENQLLSAMSQEELTILNTLLKKVEANLPKSE
ncbi:MarR family winged helix-turn-helix transcriptional regulator [Psychrobacter sp. I-STPA10]|uniref:MarR family winged helix-turn-helix transcriptional regulator n=1 Tax=Psychrobacter sp. I-STPA10 TaxID=2585769 RepID=UPI001E619FD1|nr:MarR family transcriptional regulator [Psychrobacter sp. I-STPA10]